MIGTKPNTRINKCLEFLKERNEPMLPMHIVEGAKVCLTPESLARALRRLHKQGTVSKHRQKMVGNGYITYYKYEKES